MSNQRRMHTNDKTLKVLNLTCDSAVITIKQQHCTQIRIYYRPICLLLIPDPFLLNEEHVGADLAAVLLRRGGGPCEDSWEGQLILWAVNISSHCIMGKRMKSLVRLYPQPASKKKEPSVQFNGSSGLHFVNKWQLIDWSVICGVRFCSMTLLCLHPTPTGRLSPCPCR